MTPEQALLWQVWIAAAQAALSVGAIGAAIWIGNRQHQQTEAQRREDLDLPNKRFRAIAVLVSERITSTSAFVDNNRDDLAVFAGDPSFLESLAGLEKQLQTFPLHELPPSIVPIAIGVDSCFRHFCNATRATIGQWSGTPADALRNYFASGGGAATLDRYGGSIERLLVPHGTLSSS